MKLPYSFARRHGVVITGEGEDAVAVALRDGDDASALIEVRRVARRPLRIERVASPGSDFFAAMCSPFNYAAGAAILRLM